ncbi:MAG TPA: alkaline phosphatase PhoX [Gaiellaceae bacterium]|nr:alkaline phosphatase PhoX [Gaiellaceae bacterium]
MTDFFEAAFEAPMSRRRLIKGIAAAGAATWAGTASGRALAATTDHVLRNDFAHFRAIAPSAEDRLDVPDGYEVDLLLKWGDEFGPGLRFGYNCDYSAFFPFRGRSDEGVMWINHEYVTPFFTSDWNASDDPRWNPRVEPYRSIMQQEMKEVGGSLVHVRRASRNRGRWVVVENSQYNRRFYGDSPQIPYTGPVAGTSLVPRTVAGTLANCSGCHTPWGTVLSCEENHQSYGLQRRMPFQLGWIRGNGSTPQEVNYYVGEPGTNVDGQRVGDNWPHNGYVVEVDPFTGRAVKHTALGRIHHENVAIRIARDGRVVAYTGDDAPAADGMFFKFVSSGRFRRGMSREDGMRLLADGQLYVAQWFPEANDPAVDHGRGRWHPLNMRDPESCAFTTAWIEKNIVPAAGGNLRQFRVPRAEDCEVLPGTQQRVLIALTSARGRPADPAAYGVVRLLREDSANPDEREFGWVDLLEGGQQTGFANPDNMAFSSERELWVVTDISGSSLNRPGRNFEWHMNNAIFYVPLRGPNAMTAFRFANGPVDAELTGPTFVPGQKTLFLNVQHPGEETPSRGGRIGDPQTYTSWWPEGNRTAGTGTPAKPKPSLVAIRKT